MLIKKRRGEKGDFSREGREGRELSDESILG